MFGLDQFIVTSETANTPDKNERADEDAHYMASSNDSSSIQGVVPLWNSEGLHLDINVQTYLPGQCTLHIHRCKTRSISTWTSIHLEETIPIVLKFIPTRKWWFMVTTSCRNFKRTWHSWRLNGHLTAVGWTTSSRIFPVPYKMSFVEEWFYVTARSSFWYNKSGPVGQNRPRSSTNSTRSC